MNKSISSFAKTFLAVFFIAITSVSCSEDDVVQSLGFEELGELHMKFKFNGTVYSMQNPTTVNFTNKTVDAFQGGSGNRLGVTLFMPVYPTVGVHFVTATPSDDDTYGAYFISEGNNIDILADQGIINITTVTDEYVKGTFYFSGPNGAATINITEGTFLANK